MNAQNTAQWADGTLTTVSHYDYPEPHVCTLRLERCHLEDPACQYWVACDGQAFGIKESTGQTCLAIIEQGILLAGGKCVYVIWTPKNRKPATLRAWVAKWTKRTTIPDRWDASVRCAA